MTIRIETPEQLRLQEDRAILLFQSTRELLVNAAKHAGTKEAMVMLTQHDGVLRLTVQDHGLGFDPSSNHADPSADSSSTDCLVFESACMPWGTC